MASSPTISIDAIDEENFQLLDKLENFEINDTGFEDDPDLMQAMITSILYLEKQTVSMNILIYLHLLKLLYPIFEELGVDSI